MTEEVTTPVEETPTNPVTPEEPKVDLDSNPPAGDETQTPATKADQQVETPAEEPAADEPATEEPAAEEPAEEPKETVLDKNVWGDTGSEIGNDVLTVLQESGISTEDAKALMWDAVAAGDVTKIDRDALVEKVGKAQANIILRGTEVYINDAKAASAASDKVVFDAVGGKDNWDKVAAWSVDNIPEETLAEYRPMIEKGGAQAKFAVAEILSSYNAADGNSTISVETPRAEPTSVSPPASTATTRAEYVAALEKAHRRGASQKEIATIQAQREAGRKRGI